MFCHHGLIYSKKDSIRIGRNSVFSTISTRRCLVCRANLQKEQKRFLKNKLILQDNKRDLELIFRLKYRDKSYKSIVYTFYGGWRHVCIEFHIWCLLWEGSIAWALFLELWRSWVKNVVFPVDFCCCLAPWCCCCCCCCCWDCCL